jgi:MoxR-like ATPase
MSQIDVPRGELFADPSARLVWAAICTLEEAAQHEVLRALRERLALANDRDTPQAVRVARAVADLREASELLEPDEQLSVEVFKRVPKTTPDWRWPPESSIRRWLGGSWNDALRRAGLDAVPHGDALTYHLGSAISRHEAITAVKQCADERGYVPSLSQYVFWAKQPAVRRRAGRRPASQASLDAGALLPSDVHREREGPPLRATMRAQHR